ncbi:MAG: OFA family MFS transporter [Thermoplasmata archaeon]|jgi:OFA family oxalate/formate antiporter-like MFS transporter|nr:OFA family MFS transporter [Thermoplasmata archaeon]
MGETGEKKLPNRWIRVIGALLVQLALGSIYAWSVFNKPLAYYIDDGAYGAKSLAILGIFATSLAGFGFFVSVGGRLQDKHGPKKVAMLAGVIYALGYIMSSQFYESLPMMYVSYAMLGIGVGIGYSCPLSCCVKWFPDKRGLISGIAVAGFGAGTFIFAQVGSAIIGASPYDGLTEGYLYLGLIFLGMVVAGAFLLCDPPTGYCPAGWSPPQSGAGSMSMKAYKPKEMVRTRTFWLLWAMFVLSATCGLMMIGNISNLAQNMETIYADANPGFDPDTENVMVTTVANIATLTGILAIFNGTGRVAWGFVSDKVGRTKGMKLMFLMQSIVLLAAAAFVLSKPTDEMTQFVGVTALVSLVGFCFGGNFALFPPTTAEFFGTKTFGSNYGIVFTSYGVGGIVGALMPGIITGGFEIVFMATGIGSLVAFSIAWITKPPVEEGPAEKKAAPA